MNHAKTIDELIRNRQSCRSYKSALTRKQEETLGKMIAELPECPFNSAIRFPLMNFTGVDKHFLKDIGTYGNFKNASSFIAGIVSKEDSTGMQLEDFGYLGEILVLQAEEAGLGTCWVTLSFNPLKIAELCEVTEDDTVASIIMVGNRAERKRPGDRLARVFIKANARKSCDQLFFLNDFGHPLDIGSAGEFGKALEMLRLAPSGCNYQPWRIMKNDRDELFHFFIQRNYEKRNPVLMGKSTIDWQRIDLGIAMAHFELTLRGQAIQGRWLVNKPSGIKLPQNTEYRVSWTTE